MSHFVILSSPSYENEDLVIMDPAHFSPLGSRSAPPTPSSSSCASVEEHLNASPESQSNPGHSQEAMSAHAEEQSVVEQLKLKICNLEEMVAGKDAAIVALTQDLQAAHDVSCVDASIGPLPVSFDSECKTSIAEYYVKLQENTAAIAHRDGIIEKLSSALKQSNAFGKSLKEQVNRSEDQVQLLQLQLRTVSEHLQEPQKRLLATLKNKEEELQRKSLELAHCKAQSADEVKSLMGTLEKLQQQGFQTLLSTKAEEHSSNQMHNEIVDLRQHYESDIQRLEKNLDQAELEKNSLCVKLDASQHNCAELTSSLCSMRLTHETEALALKEEIQNLLQQHSKECEFLKNDARSSQEELKHMKDKASHLQAEILKMDFQLKDKAELYFKQESENDLLRTQIEKYSCELSSYQQTIRLHELELNKLKLYYADKVTDALGSHSAEVILLQEQLAKLQLVHAEDLTVRQNKFIDELRSMEHSHENEMKINRQALEHLKTESKEKSEKITSLERHVKTLEEKLHTEFEYDKEQIRTLKQKLKDKENTETTLHKELKEIHLVKSEDNSLGKQMEIERHKTENAVDALEVAQNQLSIKQQLETSLRQELEAMKSNFTSCQSKSRELKQRLAEIDKHNQNLLLQLQEEKSLCSLLNKKVEALKQELEHEQKLSLCYKNEIETLNLNTKEISLKSASSEALQEEIENLSKKLKIQLIDVSKLESLQHTLSKEMVEKKKLLQDFETVQLTLNSERELKDLYIKKCKDLESEKSEILSMMECYKSQTLKYEKEIANLQLYLDKSHLECQNCKVRTCEDQANNLNTHPVSHNAVMCLVEKCRSDVEFLRNVSFPNKRIDDLISECCSDDSKTDEVPNSYCDQSNSSDHHALKRRCDRLSRMNSILLEKLKTIQCIGSGYLEKLLVICNEALDKEEQNSEKVLALYLSKSHILIEKLQMELEKVTEQYTSLLCNHSELDVHCKEEVGDLKPPSQSDSKVLLNSNVSEAASCVSFWINRCNDLEKKQSMLLKEAYQLQSQLAESELKLSFKTANPEETDSHRKYEEEVRFQSASYDEKLGTLLSKIQNLHEKFESKMCVNLLGLSEEECSSDVQPANISLKLKPVIDLASKSSEILVLQDQLKTYKLECQTYKHQSEMQSKRLQALSSLLNESWRENSSLQTDLQTALQEARIFRARMNRFETFHESSKQRVSIVEEGILKMVRELNTDPATSSHEDLEKSCTPQSDVSLSDQLELSIKMSKKMLAECESCLAKLQEEGNVLSPCGYLQSEALNLRRLHASLQDLHKALNSRSGPALQIHIDLLHHQLGNIQSMYKETCESMFALEAELRQLEEEKQQLEESFLKKLSKNNVAAKYWQLKAEADREMNAAARHLQQHERNVSLPEIISQLDALYSKCSVEMCAEFERTAAVREDQVRLEMTEKISNLELRHKQRLDQLTQLVGADSSLQYLQELHKQELAAVCAANEHRRMKEMLEVQRQFSSPLKCSLNLKPLSIGNLSLQLIKYDASTHFNTAVRKLALNLNNEWEKQLSGIHVQLKPVGPDQNWAVKISDDTETDLKHMENIVLETKVVSEELFCTYSTALRSLLSSLEKEFKNVMVKLQETNKDLQESASIIALQDELKKTKEEHRLAIESISARHCAEEARLRLMLCSAESSKGGSNEAALIALRRELEEKHKRQMEDLRTYFEQKCADFEKHYSEEVFSQHSRKMSDGSSASESELVSEMYYAGPGSAASVGPQVPSNLCDSLGESSFKDFEERTQSVDFEKLFRDHGEQLESMRLALESRHQGELEALKEAYEARVEELLRDMNDRHLAEVQLQSRRYQDVQLDQTSLQSQLKLAEEEVKSLKSRLNDRESECAVSKVKHLGNADHVSERESAHNAQVQNLKDAVKKKENESSAQVATLKAKLREKCETLSKLDQDITSLRAKHSQETISLKNSLAERDLKIKELTAEIHQQSINQVELEQQLRHKLKEDLDFGNETRWKELHEKLQAKDLENDNILADLRAQLLTQHESALLEQDVQNKQAMSELTVKYDNLLKEKKTQLDTEYAEYLDFVKKCADETKVQLLEKHAQELSSLTVKYEQQIADLNAQHEQILNENVNANGASSIKGSPISLKKLLQERGLISNIPSDCMPELLKISDELVKAYTSELTALASKQNEVVRQLERELESQADAVREECERLFHAQLEEARKDIVRALEHHIQLLLDGDEDGEIPQELVELEKILAFKYQSQFNDMQKEFDKRVAELQERHSTELEKLQSRFTKPFISDEEIKCLYKERDCLRNVAASLRDVVAELVRYFISCEDELNGTLFEELAKLELDRDIELLSLTMHESSHVAKDEGSMIQDTSCAGGDLSLVIATPSSEHRPCGVVKRVRFARDVSGILSLIDDDSILESMGLSARVRDASLNFHEELNRCLVRLRCESAALLELSKPVHALPKDHERGEVEQLRKEVEEMKLSKEQVSSRLAAARRSVRQLQQDNETLEVEQERLLSELQATRHRLAALEGEARQHAELVAEGYGEGEGVTDSEQPASSSPRATNAEELQDKARTLLLGAGDCGALSPNTSQQLPLVVEELCRDWERLSEDARRKHDDLQQQVEAADKQLRSTRTFLDEQAAEREQERDDFVREIRRLHEQLQEKDRERNSHQQMNHEVEALEAQWRESQIALQEASSKVKELDADHKQAVDKIWSLRDIISDLEVQVASKSEEAASVQMQNEALQSLLEEQGRTQFELAQEMEALQHGASNVIFADRISQLEEEVRKYHLQAEQFGDLSAVHQIKSQLHELEVSLEVRTKEMECAHASAATASPCLSSPSEDVSIRETLEAMRAAAGDNQPSERPLSPITLPVEEVSRVQEQWQRHLRVDDALLKRVRDLDMRLENLQAEKDMLLRRLQEQLHLVSTLEGKLDEHRLISDARKAEVIAPLRYQIDVLEGELQTCVETLEARERKVENLERALRQAEVNLNKYEMDVKETVLSERSFSAQLQNQVSKLTAEKDKLQALLSEKKELDVSFPQLVRSMLADKNADIDHLEKQVQELTEQIQLGSQYIATPSTKMEFMYCEQEKLRAHVELSPVLELKRSFDVTSAEIEISQLKDFSRVVEVPQAPMDGPVIGLNESHLPLIELEPQIQPIPEDTVSPELLTVEDSRNKHESTDFSSASETSELSQKRVAALKHELEERDQHLLKCQTELSEKGVLIAELQKRSKQVEDFEKKITEMSSLEEKLKAVQEDLQNAVAGVKADKEYFETQLEMKNSEVEQLRNNLSATQEIAMNLRKKVQEAKQIARSPQRSPSDANVALEKVQNELQYACQENAQLKEQLLSIKSEAIEQYQQREVKLEELLECERQTIKSLQDDILKYQQEVLSFSEMLANKEDIEKQLIKSKDELQTTGDMNEKLQNEVKQVNMECVSLKRQLLDSDFEPVNLSVQLEAERKFARTLQEELSMFKIKACNLERECQNLTHKLKELEQSSMKENNVECIMEENNSLHKDISILKNQLNQLDADRSKHAEKRDQEVALLREENVEVNRELSDLKRALSKMHGLEASRNELQKALNEQKVKQENAVSENSVLSKKLMSLRSALENIDHMRDLSGLADEDFDLISNVCQQNKRGLVDRGKVGRLLGLSTTEINVYEIRPDSSQFSDSGSLDDLTGMVRQELNLSVQLDDTLLQTLDPLTIRKPLISPPARSQADLPAKSKETVSQSSRGEGFSSQVEPKRTDVKHLLVRMQILEMELSKEKAAARLYLDQLETQRLQYDTLQKQDSDLIEELRLKLAKSLDVEAQLRMQLHTQINRAQPSCDFLCLHQDSQDKSFGAPAKPSSDTSETIQKLRDELYCVVTELAKTKMDRDGVEKKLRRLQEAEIRRSRRRAANEEQLKGQIERLQAIQTEKQQELSVLRQQLAMKTEELNKTRQELAKEREGQLNLNSFVEELIESKNTLSKQIKQFTEENKQMRARIAQLEQEFSDVRRTENSDLLNVHFAAEHAAWEQERSALQRALKEGRARHDPDIEDRVERVFGLYLRSESYRKALSWQKRYLLVIIDGFAESEALASSHLSALRNFRSQPGRQLRPYQKFRSAVFAIYAVHRMRYMVSKWLRGKRIGSGFILNQASSCVSFTPAPFVFDRESYTSPSLAGMSADEVRAGMSHSPPTLDRPRQSRAHLVTSQVSRVSKNLYGPSNSLSECLRNFDILNQRFDVVMSRSPK